MSNSRWPLVWALNSLHPLASGSRSQPIPSPPKIVRPSFRCSARRQHRRLPTGRKVLPYPVGDFGRPFVPAFDRGISYFRQRGNPEVGLTLTNKHPQFQPSTRRQGVTGGWICLEAGDLNGDGNLDLAETSLIGMPTAVLRKFKALCNEKGPSVLILRLRRKP